MKRIALLLLPLVLVLPVGYVFWPYDKLVLALDAGSRVEDDIAAGYPLALRRAQEVEALVRRDHPELRRARHAWTEVRCGIDDLVTQFPTGYFAQDCALRKVWLVSAPDGGTTCGSSEDLYGALDPVGDAVATRIRATSADLLAPEAELGPFCPPIGPEPDDSSHFIYGTAETRLLAGRWPDGLPKGSAWDVFEIEVWLSSTELGCVPAFMFCRGRFEQPQMGGVEALPR